MIKGQKRRLTVIICAVIAIALLTVGATSLFATADPANSGFEGVSDGLPMGWIKVSGEASTDYSESISGTPSLKLEGALSAVRQRYVPAVGGETYLVKAQVKVDNANASTAQIAITSHFFCPFAIIFSPFYNMKYLK